MTQASDCRPCCSVPHQAAAGAARARTAHVVAFPHMALPSSYDPVDMPRASCSTRTTSGPGRGDRQAIERHGEGHQPLDEIAFEGCCRCSSPNCRGRHRCSHLPRSHEQRVDQLTRIRHRSWRASAITGRLSVIGGRGPAKTWLALEQARRLAKDGKRWH